MLITQKRFLGGVGLLVLLLGLGLSYSYAVNAPLHIYVTDTGNSRIVRIDDMTGKNWTVLDKLNADDRFHFLNGHIFVDTAGKIYVGDDLNHRIVRMDDMTGKNLTMLGTEGGDPKQF